jgi:ketosteroid isomerase-like protein
MSAPVTQVSPSIQEAIRETNRQFEDLFNRGEPAGAARAVYTTDARVLPPGAPVIQGRDNIEKFWPAAAAQLDIRKLSLRTVDLQPLGDGAVEVGAATLTTGNGQSVEVKYVVVWRQEDGQWRWQTDIWNTNA